MKQRPSVNFMAVSSMETRVNALLTQRCVSVKYPIMLHVCALRTDDSEYSQENVGSLSVGAVSR